MESYGKLSFSAVIEEVTKKYANNKALGFFEEDGLTYAQMGVQIKATMAFLEAHEVKPGDKVVIYSQNMPNWGCCLFCTSMYGSCSCSCFT
jgi:long-chain acyl-CoA synthetase